jgi:hypothetical protein
VGRSRSLGRARPLQFDPSAERSEESGAVAEQDRDEVDLHLVQESRPQIPVTNTVDPSGLTAASLPKSLPAERPLYR